MNETDTEDVASRLSRRISRFAERFLSGNGESHTINYAYTLRTKPLSGLYTVTRPGTIKPLRDYARLSAVYTETS